MHEIRLQVHRQCHGKPESRPDSPAASYANREGQPDHSESGKTLLHLKKQELALKARQLELEFEDWENKSVSEERKRRNAQWGGR